LYEAHQIHSFFVLFLAAFNGVLSAASLKGHVWVAGSNNVPIANASIRIVRIIPDSSFSYQTTSQADGSYAFNNIETGTYLALCEGQIINTNLSRISSSRQTSRN
jgi:hypothetical protein